MTPAATAEQCLRQRRKWASRNVAEGKWVRDEAEARLRPWLHVALLAGADLSDLADQSATVIFPFERAGETVRVPLAVDLLPLTRGERDNALSALAEARDHAIAAFDREPTPARSEQARQLCRLAEHLGAAPCRLTSSALKEEAA